MKAIENKVFGVLKNYKFFNTRKTRFFSLHFCDQK